MYTGRYSQLTLLSLITLLIFVSALQIKAQKPTLVSVQAFDVASGGTLSEDPVVSANGRFVAFESSAFNLVPNDNNGRTDVFVRDLQNGSTTLVSINLNGTGGGNGDSQNPAISADGRYVAFESRASNLVANDTNTVSDIFVRDLQAGITTLVSVNSAGTGSGNESSLDATISANGHVVAFRSFASNLSNIDGNNTVDVFARDLQTSTTHLVSCNVTCTAAGNDASFTSNVPKDKAPRANISNDGRIVVFESRATDLVTVPKTSNAFSDVFARDLQTGTTTLVSVNKLGTASAGGAVPVISGNGRFAVFQSSANDITSNDFGSGLDLFERDLQTGTTTMVSVTILNAGSSGPLNSGYFPIVSTDGRYITFQSNAKDYVANDTNSGYDVFRRDVQTNTTTLISGTTSGGTGIGNDALGAVMSSDGRFVAFIGFGTDFVPTPDTNNRGDVYLRDVAAGTTTLLSSNITGTDAANIGATYPVISSDGRFTYFESGSTDLVVNPMFGISIFGVATPGRVSFDQTQLTLNETATTATFGLTRSGNTSGAITVQYATSNGSASSGSDYSPISGSVTFADGETTKSIVIPINNDEIDEPDENLLVVLSDFNSGGSAGSLSSTILTITDDDPPPTISIDDVTLTEGNGESKQGEFTLTLSSISAKPVVVNISVVSGSATPNVDYMFNFTQISVTPGSLSQKVFFQILSDVVFEEDEAFSVTLSNPVNATIAKGQAQATIQNDDPLPSISINDSSIIEGKSGSKLLFFAVNLSNPSSKPITVDFGSVDGTASGPNDYVPTGGTLTFLPGFTTRFFGIQINGDPVVEPDETLVVNLLNPTQATLSDAQGIGTILNDDFPPVLLLEPNNQSAAALDAVLWLRDPFPLTRQFNLSTDLHTRVSLFALNLDLVSGETGSAVSATAEDEFGNSYSLPVEFVGIVPADNTVSQVIVRLPDDVGPAHELRIKLSLRGQVSNPGTIRIASP